MSVFNESVNGSHVSNKCSHFVSKPIPFVNETKDMESMNVLGNIQYLPKRKKKNRHMTNELQIEIITCSFKQTNEWPNNENIVSFVGTFNVKSLDSMYSMTHWHRVSLSGYWAIEHKAMMHWTRDGFWLVKSIYTFQLVSVGLLDDRLCICHRSAIAHTHVMLPRLIWRCFVCYSVCRNSYIRRVEL